MFTASGIEFWQRNSSYVLGLLTHWFGTFGFSIGVGVTFTKRNMPIYSWADDQCEKVQPAFVNNAFPVEDPVFLTRGANPLGAPFLYLPIASKYHMSSIKIWSVVVRASILNPPIKDGIEFGMLTMHCTEPFVWWTESILPNLTLIILEWNFPFIG